MQGAPPPNPHHTTTSQQHRTMEPFYWLNEDARTFLNRGYLLDGVSAEQRIRKIAEHAQSLLTETWNSNNEGAEGPPKPIAGFADRFEHNMAQGYYSLASPVWSNFGLGRGLPISCFGSYIGDSMGSILYTHAEVGAMTKYGGGTSGYFGDIRPRGEDIGSGESYNGKSNGSYSFTRLFDTVIDVVSQGETRRGQFAGYIDIEHDDIDEWLNIRTEGNPIQDMYWGVCIGDEWMQAMIDGDREKRETWAKVIEARVNLGVPYLLFRDNVNDGRPQVYKDLGYRVHASNLCITGDQRVVTDRGYLTAEQLYEQGGALTLFDGEAPVEASEMKLRERDADVYRVTLENGVEQKMTAYHGVPVVDSKGRVTRTECRDLSIGDRVQVQTNKGLFGDKHMPDEAFLLALYQSGGTQHKEFRMIDVWENDFDLLDEIEERFSRIHDRYDCGYADIGGGKRGKKVEPSTFVDQQTGVPDVAKKRLYSKMFTKAGLSFDKGFVPDWVWESDEETQWQYVRGLLYADGSAYMSPQKCLQISYVDTSLSFVKELQLLFNNLGLQSSVRVAQEAGMYSLPEGKGGQTMCHCSKTWRLLVSNKPSGLEIERNTGFLSRKGVHIEDRSYRNNTRKAYPVRSIEHVGTEDVYCPTVDSEDHVFASQGAITFNCSEIALPSTPDESFVCCLSSMNAARYDDWRGTDAVRVMTMFLDAVMTEFVQKSEDVRFLERAHRFARRHRSIGIGVLGWHDLLQSRMLPFDSWEAMQLNTQLFSQIDEESHSASEELADLLGEPEVMEGRGRRHTTTTAVAPTKSSSYILGQVSPSIEPLKSNYHVRDRAKIKTTYRNPALADTLSAHGRDNEATWESIGAHDGSVQHLEFLTDHERDVFRTFEEISQGAIVNQAAQRQPYIDQSQSLNIAVDASQFETREINALYIDAWRKGVKTMYYQNNVNAAQKLSRDLLDCSACEA